MGEQTTGERVTVLYGSDTGNAEQVAKNFHFELKRRGMRAKCMSLNEVEVPDLQDAPPLRRPLRPHLDGDSDSMPLLATPWHATLSPAHRLVDSFFPLFAHSCWKETAEAGYVPQQHPPKGNTSVACVCVPRPS